MEAVSNIGWVLLGTSTDNPDTKLTDEQVSKMLHEAFEENRVYELFLCGAYVDQRGTLAELEIAYKLISEKMEELGPTDFGIVSIHDEGRLLFIPSKIAESDEVEELSGNTDTVQ